MATIKWQLQNENIADDAVVAELCRELNILPATAKLLWKRGYRTTQSAREFIRKEDGIFHDPYLMKDMDKAVERVILAQRKKEKVMIFGDYDVDGVTSVSVLYLYLRSIGINCDYHIPSRTGEGYGISKCAVDNIADDGYSLMISVDTGITAFDEIEYAKSIGLETIVTDHHECHVRIPDAVAVVNPKRHDCTYPFKELAGVGVVFKFITAIEMNRVSDISDALSTVCNEYSDLVATGTIADVMPLYDENRLIVSMGLKKLELDTRVGMKTLLEKAGVIQDDKAVRVTSSTIGYSIAPRINAAGRLSEASIAVELMLSTDEKKANELAELLCDINVQRKDEENAIAKEAAEMINGDYDFANNPVIVLAKENWHHGVIGIVASRLTDKYGHPTILVSFDEDGMGKGSGRSVKGLNLVEALSCCSDVLEKFGGHELAAGLSVEKKNFDEFKRRINEYAVKQLGTENTEKICTVDLVLDENEINERQADELYLLEPYGTGNPPPVFVLCDAQINEITGIGFNKHCRISLKKNSKFFSAVLFGHSPDSLEFSKGDTVDAVFSLEINEYRKHRNLQLNLKHILLNRKYIADIERWEELYTDIKNGAHYKHDDNIFPSRPEFASLYTYIKRKSNSKAADFSRRELLCEVALRGENSGVKLDFMLDVFEEMKLLSVKRNNGEFDKVYNITVKFVRGKVNLDKSLILKNLRSKQEKV
ncbi:MAG: single-stranded-DNA-specific exonuclease RecJ [Clostridia bacterium]|nr:single-stranded-DNA-specific exonuclease RecJ [Clostridia bacterium]